MRRDQSQGKSQRPRDPCGHPDQARDDVPLHQSRPSTFYCQSRLSHAQAIERHSLWKHLWFVKICSYLHLIVTLRIVGRGLYSSPDVTFSLMYSGLKHTVTKSNEFAGLKVIVCATVTGRCRYMTRDDDWRMQTTAFPGSHSHAANDLMEYVVFDATQMIPCYVIHLDLGQDAAKYVMDMRNDEDNYMLVLEQHFTSMRDSRRIRVQEIENVSRRH